MLVYNERQKTGERRELLELEPVSWAIKMVD